MKQKKVGVISLGCDKNRVDTEKMLGILREHYELTNELSEAEIVIVNTCAFLESARREAIEEILAADRMRSDGKLEKLVVTGCLPQRFASELEGALTEADLLLGISDYEKLPALIEESYRENRQISAVGGGNCETNAARVLTTPAAYAYLKIADGCCNHCTYCLIPKIRGAYRSVPEAALIEEAGLKGYQVGGEAISAKHAGFAVNLGGATAADVKALLSQVSEQVYQKSGIRLEPEVRIW